MNKVVEGLNSLSPGFLPKDIFEAIARLVVTPTFVVIPFIRTKEGVKVCLKRRDNKVSGDIGLLHPTGTIILATDKTLEDTYERLVDDELSDVEIIGKPVLCEIIFAEILRGKEITLLHYVEIDSASPEDLYDPENLPDDVVETDLPRIEITYQKFQIDSKIK